MNSADSLDSLGSPRLYRIQYDGISEFGELKVGQSMLAGETGQRLAP